MPVDPAALRGLITHAESHWLTFATALRCYELQPTQPEIRRAADRHGPSWLRSALHGQKKPKSLMRRPKELDPKTGSLAFLTAGAEEAMRKPESSGTEESTPVLNPVVAPTPRVHSQRTTPVD